MNTSLVAKYSNLPGVKSAGATLKQSGARNIQNHSGPPSPGAVPRLVSKYGGTNQARALSKSGPSHSR